MQAIIKFKNEFEQQEINGVVNTLYSIVARDISTKKKYSRTTLKMMLLRDNTKSTIEIGLKNRKFKRLLEDFRTIGLPYLITVYKKGNPLFGTVYNGVTETKIQFDDDGNIVGRMDGILEAIDLLEQDEDMKALILLNHFCIRTDIENMPRMAFSIPDS